MGTLWARARQHVNRSGDVTTRKYRDFLAFQRWARVVSNHRPLACEASALPLSYAPLCSANQRYLAASRVSPDARSFRAISGNSCDEIMRITEMLRGVGLTRWMLSSTSNRAQRRPASSGARAALSVGVMDTARARTPALSDPRRAATARLSRPAEHRAQPSPRSRSRRAANGRARSPCRRPAGHPLPVNRFDLPAALGPSGATVSARAIDTAISRNDLPGQGGPPPVGGSSPVRAARWWSHRSRAGNARA